ncbi:MAG: co-chaperone GroES [Bdellovibrionota bacterium]
MAKKKAVKKASKPAAKKAVKKAAKPAAKKMSAKAPAKKAAKKAAPKKTAAKAIPAMKAANPKAAPKKAAASKAPAAPAPKAPAKFRVGLPLDDLFTPLDDRLIVEATIEATRTAGGLFIPDTVSASEGPKQGKVVAVGRGHRGKKGKIRPLDVQLGDTVMYEAYLGAEMKIGDRELVVLRESQLLGIVK